MEDRRTICFPRRGGQDVVESGDPLFSEEISRLYPVAENNALEGLVALKARLRETSTDDFWTAATEGLSSVLGAEMSFVFKRVLVDDQEVPVEMPPQGAPGSCMMAAAFHYCTNDGSKNTLRGQKFYAYGCPCAYMRHDKVFVIPDNLNEFITNNPNQLPTPAEAYIAVPLFAEGKCFAHFGAMWTKESAAKRCLSWGFIEMLLHSLEDMFLQRFLEGSNFIKPSSTRDRPRVIPHEAVTVAQSLRPYAGSLSHELRTPMQGVVGMLDVMYATVLETGEGHADPNMRRVFEELRDQIQVVQDSSRRAVEAADNVVHAYDMNMAVPEGPPQMPFDDSLDSGSPFSTTATDKRPEILVAGSNLPMSRPNKRRREEQSSRQTSNASPSKVARLEEAASAWSKAAEPSQEIRSGLEEAEILQAHGHPTAEVADLPETDPDLATNGFNGTNRNIAPGLRHTNMREVFQYVINEGLKVGGRPDSVTAQETDDGEVIEVRSRGSDGGATSKTIEWSVDPSVPRTMFIDEKDLTKLISCVFLNAIKFTDEVNGRVVITAKMSSRGRFISIRISDNGPGIPAAFLPKLFKPFSREHGSITRPSEGLGLGLMVAKGIARKLGGDLMCIRAETDGENRGSEFEIKTPVHAGETISRPSSPFGSPLPRRAQAESVSATPSFPPAAPASPHQLAQALHQVVDSGIISCSSLPQTGSSTPPSPNTHLAIPSASHRSSSPPSPTTDTDSTTAAPRRPRPRKSISTSSIDRSLASKYPLTFLVVEDNKINRKLLVSMLTKFGYKTIYEAHDGTEAVRQMSIPRPPHSQINVILMDLWMPLMDGYTATQEILAMGVKEGEGWITPTVLAVTADVTDGALERAAQVGMQGFLSKPYKMQDLQRLITEYCAKSASAEEEEMAGVPAVAVAAQ